MEYFVKKFIEGKPENLPTVKDVYDCAIKHNLMTDKNVRTLKKWNGTEEDKILWLEYVDWWKEPREMPSYDEIEEAAEKYQRVHGGFQTDFIAGAIAIRDGKITKQG